MGVTAGEHLAQPAPMWQIPSVFAKGYGLIKLISPGLRVRNEENVVFDPMSPNPRKVLRICP